MGELGVGGRGEEGGGGGERVTRKGERKCWGVRRVSLGRIGGSLLRRSYYYYFFFFE